jgi:hypothetical protein
MIRLEAYGQSNDILTQLDVFEGEAPRITKEVANVEDFFKKTANHTQEFALPFSDKNNQFFAHYYNANTDTTFFNASVKTSFNLYDSNILVMQGYLKLNEVDIINEVYSVTLFGETANLAAEIGDINMNELFYQSTLLNHALTLSNVLASWNNALPLLAGGTTSDIIYPTINWTNAWQYGVNGCNTPQGAITLGAFRPAIRIKYLIDRIFALAGFTYNSAFLDSTYFSKIYMTFGAFKGGLAVNVVPSGFKTNRTSDLTLTGATPAIIFNNYIYAVADYNTTTGEYTAPVTGNYNFLVRLTHKRNIVGADVGKALLIYINGLIASTSSSSLNYVSQNTFSFTSPGGGSSATSIFTYSAFLRAGDDISLAINNFGTGITLEMASEATYWQLLTQPINSAGGTVTLFNNLPNNIKAIDFLKSILNRFNLYIEEDLINSKMLYIEPFNDYYNGSNEDDWTNIIDQSQPILISPLDDLRKKKLIFQDQEDANWYIQRELQASGRVYGDYNYLSTSQFADGEEVINSVFAPMPINKVDGSQAMFTGFNIEFDGTTFQTYDAKPTLIYWDGKKTIAASSDYYYTYDYQTDTTIQRNEWAPASHFSNAPTTAVTENIQFGNWSWATAEIYQAYVQNNIYNKYWAKYVNEIYSDDARKLVGYFYLSPTALSGLRLNTLIFIKDAWYRISKIDGYTTGTTLPTRVELFKALDLFTFNCSVVPDQYLESGEVTFKDLATGVTVDATENCCELAGFTYIASSTKCWWKVLLGGGKATGGSAGTSTSGGMEFDGLDEGNNIGEQSEAVGYSTDNSDNGGSALFLGSGNNAEGFDEVVIIGSGQTATVDNYIGEGQTNGTHTSGQFSLFFPGTEATTDAYFINYADGNDSIALLSGYNYALDITVNVSEDNGTFLFMQRVIFGMKVDTSGTVTQIFKRSLQLEDATSGGITVVNLVPITNGVKLQIENLGIYDSIGSAIINGQFFPNNY